MEEAGTITGPHGQLAFRRLDGVGPTLVWMGGLKSDMTGTKAEALAGWATKTGRAFLRFDYSGHGASEGRFENGSITRWLADALAVIDFLTKEPLILVGSSMGAWIAALVAMRRRKQIAGIVFIAPAPDFTEDLVWRRLTGEDRDRLTLEGRIILHSTYSEEPTILTLGLVEDGRRHLILGGEIAFDCPVRILQGMADPDVPWRHALKFAEKLNAADMELLLIKSGDHRLSRPGDITKIIAAIESIN